MELVIVIVNFNNGSFYSNFELGSQLLHIAQGVLLYFGYYLFSGFGRMRQPFQGTLGFSIKHKPNFNSVFMVRASYFRACLVVAGYFEVCWAGICSTNLKVWIHQWVESLIVKFTVRGSKFV